MPEKAQMRLEKELDVLKSEYDRLISEIRDRYGHHYHFHYLLFVTAGALTGVYVGLKDPQLRTAVFLLVPAILLPLTLLMLKEHAYMDLRESYIRTVLRPRIVDLLNSLKPDERTGTWIFGWGEWEERVLRNLRGPSWLFGIFGSAEYLLPLALSGWALYAFAQSTRVWPRAETAVFYVEMVLLFLLCGFAFVSRVWQPHLPSTDTKGTGQSARSEQDAPDQKG